MLYCSLERVAQRWWARLVKAAHKSSCLVFWDDDESLVVVCRRILDCKNHRLAALEDLLHGWGAFVGAGRLPDLRRQTDEYRRMAYAEALAHWLICSSFDEVVVRTILLKFVVNVNVQAP